MKQFNYREFKEDMQTRGHKVTKNGQCITIKPNNGKNGFQFVEDIVEGYTDYLETISYENFNTYIYSAKFRILA